MAIIFLAACGESEQFTYDEVQADLEENKHEMLVNDGSFGESLEMIEMLSTQAALFPTTNEKANNYEIFFVAEFEIENTSPDPRRVPLDQATVKTNNGGEADVKTVGVSPLKTAMKGGQEAVSTLRFSIPGVTYSGVDYVDISFPEVEDENGEVVSNSYDQRINLKNGTAEE